ncbi:glycosyltransferase [Citrobacter freundii]|uniref:glycosyltransferase n=1 Tax=Citrobacter freundii TaxID=546 RepID=UPI00111CB1E1|nr:MULTISPECIES: glycosyltransferase [Citrobacter]MBA7994657.1 glycosyltransferase [Citrobacter freundii]MBJ8967492.1 glycosyltransferase [Citrobacter freundii]MDV1637372.1 glycosyltransferase [Citrobacter freundii]MDV1716783.1 glycosyltransferase [Citrobacter freundii]MDV1721632.1 glycosyltransferase [Citrobacter freundii]
MRILFVITGLGLGGAEKQVCLLADKLAKLGHEVLLVAATHGGNVRPKNEIIKIINLDMRKTIFGFIKSIVSLCGIIKAYKPEVIHGHMFHANVMVRIANIFLKRKWKTICTAHNKNEGGVIRKLLYRFTDKYNDVTTNVSQEALEQFIKDKAFKKSKSVAVYNGIDTDYFKYDVVSRRNIRQQFDITDGDILLLAIGRLTEAKDYPNLINSFKLLPVCYKLLVLGEGHARDDIQRIINQNNLSTRVKLLGAKDDVKQYYSACDIFVLPSAWEGFGLVVAEAMSCERIAIGTDSGGVKEVIGDSNFIIPIKDPVALAEKIIETSRLSDSAKSSICARNRSYIISNFSIDNAVNKWLNIYR